jgi:hypothetical protein
MLSQQYILLKFGVLPGIYGCAIIPREVCYFQRKNSFNLAPMVQGPTIIEFAKL